MIGRRSRRGTNVTPFNRSRSTRPQNWDTIHLFYETEFLVGTGGRARAIPATRLSADGISGTERARDARRKKGYVTTHVTKAGFTRARARFSEEKWLAALDDFRNWLIREAA
jgi:hypothetical protein